MDLELDLGLGSRVRVIRTDQERREAHTPRATGWKPREVAGLAFVRQPTPGASGHCEELGRLGGHLDAPRANGEKGAQLKELAPPLA